MRKTSFIMGLIGGIICCLYSTIILGIQIEDAMGEAGAVIAIAMFFTLSIVFIVGVSIVLVRSAAGGIMMIVSSALIFVTAVSSFFVEYFQGGLESFSGFFITLAIMGFISGILGYKARNEPKTKPQPVVYPSYMPPQQAGRWCEGCGQALQPDERFCPRCGKQAGSIQQQPQPQRYMICDRCGEQMTFDVIFCPNCGNKM